ncbi:MAG: hypothetical protein OHK93_004458 [Ramalina farinacea]|uniref:Uncharacterized protein n=1 Tax=Ramalina farinacea TaxID=258253 RepID=A0AA43TV26_9LECA|nr:hypothetical protein [Ramalina farinacea]
MQAPLLLILLSAISSSLALPAQPPAAQNLEAGYPQCLARDPGTDETWRKDCAKLIEDFIEMGWPGLIRFGTGGVPVPYIYRGPAQPIPTQCEMRIDLVNNAPSETIDHIDIVSAAATILYVCVGGFVPAQGHRLGGFLRGNGQGGNLYVALGKRRVPGPGVGNATAVQQPSVDVT